ncbi:NAD(P)-binding protein [Cenococcum geophilum 1.58]|uniref:NAD(P)-binding protein n=1 Tax=Cenococcum geophilum 1.58 TaxID=794803 RepID=UPI00358FA3C5|nr:NAD(P)-binding protein [Cenococcum geophilum 1.58]
MGSQPTNKHLTLFGKVAVVTGASRGIGASIALDLAKRGANITIVYTSARSGKPADELISEIHSMGNGAKAIKVQADLRQIEAPEKVVSATLSAFGNSIDILVNNAGVELVKPILEVSPEDFASVFDLNVRGAYLMTKAVIPHLRAPGRVINISLYSASKAALEGMTRGLAAEIGASGHTVNVVEPGPVESDMLENIPKDLVELERTMTPVEHRIGKTEDIALVVGWLAEAQSRWISGQTISASGGYTML